MSEIKQDAILSQRLLDAQVGVLGSMLIDPDTVPEVLSRVRDADFAEKKYRLIFQAIQARFRAGQAIDPILVRETLGGGVDSPWTSILQGLMDVTTTAAHVDDYVDALRASVTLSNLRTLGTQLAEADRLEDAQALLDQMRAQQVSRPHVQAMDMAEGLERFFDRHNGEEKPQYLSWGVPVLDERIFAEPGDMVVLGGYPSDGKTALALQFAFGIGRNHRVGFFSYESTRDKLFDRTVSRAAMLSYTKIKRNQLTEADYRDLLELRPQLTAPQLTLIDAAGMTVLDISIQPGPPGTTWCLWTTSEDRRAQRHPQSDFERVSPSPAVCSSLGGSQDRWWPEPASRPDRDKDGKIRPPTLSDLRSSGQIEQDADVVLFLYREDYDDKQSNRILRIAKNKEGEAMDWVNFRFDGDLQTFSRIAPETPAPPAEKPKRERQPPRQVSFWADGGSFQDTPWGKG
ncbi:MAG: replicative DNA helicase [Dysosmobacter welbionis]